MSDFKPNFYAIIPAHIRYCKELEPGAKLLYGELTALASREGYCWASNKYLASLYEVDPKTIQRWISSLVEKEFIVSEVETGGFQTTRKIWICPHIKNIVTKGQNCQGGEPKIVTPDDKNVLHINTPINTNKKTVCPKPPVGASGPPKSIKKFGTDGKEECLELDQVYRQAIQKNKDWTTSEIADVWQILCDYEGRVNDLWAFIEGTIEKIRTKKRFEKINHKKKETKSCPLPQTPEKMPEIMTPDSIRRAFQTAGLRPPT